VKPLPAFRGAISAPSYIFSRPTGQTPVLLAIGFEGMINKQLLHDKTSFILSQIRNVGNRKVPPCGRDKFINAVDLSTDLKYFSKQILIKGAEYEQALKDEQRYRANKNKASGFARQQHWIQMLG
jgi:hypothetical protein